MENYKLSSLVFADLHFLYHGVLLFNGDLLPENYHLACGELVEDQ